VQKDHFTRFILVRHGQTGWNKDERFRGRADIDLDETGLKQADGVAQRLSEWDISAVYSSPLKRAANTAKCIAERYGLSVVNLDGLNDMDFGEWEGLLVSEVREKQATLFEQWRCSPESFKVPGGESLEDVKRRAVDVVNELALKHEGENVVLVSHRVVCKVLLCHLLGLDNSHFWKIAQDSTAVNVFEIFELIGSGERRATVTLVNDTCHLKTP
jgi:broad specificity phosphatase PhoE